ncbi:hypothetical protein B0O99DRAFT_62657 [Bisporella sp. PMI_857]|nr:hypothetical protein B0O99DRAFT_62657 [Bisporella sp. PMI_857]
MGLLSDQMQIRLLAKWLSTFIDPSSDSSISIPISTDISVLPTTSTSIPHSEHPPSTNIPSPLPVTLSNPLPATSPISPLVILVIPPQLTVPGSYKPRIWSRDPRQSCRVNRDGNRISKSYEQLSATSKIKELFFVEHYPTQAHCKFGIYALH